MKKIATAFIALPFVLSALIIVVGAAYMRKLDKDLSAAEAGLAYLEDFLEKPKNHAEEVGKLQSDLIAVKNQIAACRDASWDMKVECANKAMVEKEKLIENAKALWESWRISPNTYNMHKRRLIEPLFLFQNLIG